MPVLDSQSERGQPIHAAGSDFTPVARVTRITWPGGGIEWHRPVAVEIRADQRVRQVRIHDMTRRYALASIFACLTLGGAIAAWATRERPARRTVR